MTQFPDQNAVIIVHGIDYNDNGLYDGVLDRSELNRRLPGESTAPALCGPLLAAGDGTAQAHRYVASLAKPADVLACRLWGV